MTAVSVQRNASLALGSAGVADRIRLGRPAQASTWDRVAEFLQIIQTTGVEALVGMTVPLACWGHSMTVAR